MLLSDRDIKAAGTWQMYERHKDTPKRIREGIRRSGPLRITPYNPTQLQPASYDLRLGDAFIGAMDHRFLVPTVTTLDPHHFLLAHTEEVIHLPDWLGARVEGKSSWARKGLFTHTSAGWIDPGFHGQITLELFNASSEPIPLTPGDLISQISFYLLSSPAERPYGKRNHYQGQMGATRSWLDEEAEAAPTLEDLLDVHAILDKGFSKAKAQEEWDRAVGFDDRGETYCTRCCTWHSVGGECRWYFGESLAPAYDTENMRVTNRVCDNPNCREGHR
jgi:dCTP deaminase